MTREDIFKTVDHTLLAQTATWEEIKEICDDAIKYQTASVCIPASYVKRAKDYVKLVVFSVVDKTIPESDIEICRKIAEDCGVKFRLREYIE